MSVINKTIIGHNSNTGKSPGTFGEILQGTLPNNKNFLVSIPIRKFSYAIITVTQNNCPHDLQIFPLHKTKSLKVAQILFDCYKVNCAAKIHLTSELPEGKGLASSSADMAATSHAIQNYFNLKFSSEALCSFMGTIEPTNAVMYKEMVSYYHKESTLHKKLGIVPKICIVGIDEGGIVDTLNFNSIILHYTNSEKDRYEFMLNELEKAIQQHDLPKLGEISTISAIMHQKYKQNCSLSQLIKINNEVKGLGIVIAHSGTYIGILLDLQSPDLTSQITYIKKALIMAKINIEPHIFYSHY